jgi:adenosine kinase
MSIDAKGYSRVDLRVLVSSLDEYISEVSILVTGSIATDHLMSFPGRFADSLVVDQLDKIALSFLVEDLEIRRGGCAANIAFGLGSLGLRPVLVGAVGNDFVDYRSWLERHNVDCDSVHVSAEKHTARFVCTNDSTMAQIASFYAGAMSEAREIELRPIVDRLGGADEVAYVHVGPNDPEAMLRHTQECRQRGYRFVADPSQQLAFGDGEMIRDLVEGADLLFTNEYEAALLCQKTGWSPSEVLDRVGTWVVTLGAEGVRLDRKGAESVSVKAVPEVAKVEPTGVGDAFRAGFLAALGWGLSPERAAQLGCLLAVYVVERVGTQEYTLHREAFLDRLAAAYGEQAREEIAPLVVTARP